MAGSPPRVSVILPVRDGGATLGEVLAGIAAQDVEGGFEVVAVDSGSRDGSLDALRRHGARTIEVPREAFDHGETRNLAARSARGGYLVFLTQDAVPRSPGFLRALIAPLEGDVRLAGAFARQQPRGDADPLTRRELARWVAAGEDPRVVFVSDLAAFDRLPPLERYGLSVFDDVASAVRRDLLLAHPFAASRFGEDLEWGHRMLRLGYGLAYAPAATVVHSHPRSARRLFRRNYLGHRLLYRLFGLRTIPDRRHLLRALAGTVAADLRALAAARAAAGLWLRAPAQSLAAVLGQWRGAEDEAAGRPYPGWS
jgi:rhamnosyltransferase